MKQWIRDFAASPLRPGFLSQSYQDVLLDHVFGHIGTARRPGFCVEFGFNASTLDGGSGANVARLVLHHGWNALLLDAEHENHAINLHRAMLTTDTILDVFRDHQVPRDLEYISIDVDSTDLWLFRRLLPEYRAAVYSVEYNPAFPLEQAITFPNDLREHWQFDRGYGASLRALTLVAAEQGYSLLWVVPSLDAFFIRNDLVDDGSPDIVPPWEWWRPTTGHRIHPPLKTPARAGLFLDYEVFVQSGGDLSRARAAAAAACRRHLLDN